ncbi:SprB-like repeat protein [Flavobacterium sp. 90]|uniref:hypothetical protein n=1 Tax=unclassified Flavobacterium TaxID=196869 RepID=UPI000F29F9BA|nr:MULTISPECIES: hypothetical protein [unclassified Flavobacterium]RKR08304.1 SprB-like repeat protein [Flavobacterium sp. 81]TCK57492.1 SprB-like repeat protein [Flavobacterium sp. 90]
MRTNTGDSGGYRLSYFPNGNYFYQYWIKANGNLLNPIKAAGEYLIFDQKPTTYHFSAYRPESYSCSGPCGEEWSSGLEVNNFNVNCYNASGGATGYGPVEIVPEFSIISNQVLAFPNGETGFCDKVNLQTTGCTGTQRFYWEYRIEGGTFQPTNVSTAFNETFQFNKLTYLPETYIGNIDFRVLIDSDATVTGEEVYSNIIYYNIIPCPPFLTTTPVESKTTCIYKNDGKVTLSFDRKLVDNESFLFSFYTKDNVLLPTPAYTIDSTNKIYTFLDLSQGDYYIKYQTFIGAQQTSINALPNPTFNISSETALSFEIIEVQPSCNNKPGTIQIKASGGTSPYYYSINSGTEVEFTSITNEISAPAGDYYIKVTDKKSCIDTSGIDIQI